MGGVDIIQVTDIACILFRAGVGLRAARFLSLPRRGRVDAVGGRVGGTFDQCVVNGFQHARQILVDIAIPKPKYAETAPGKISVA